MSSATRIFAVKTTFVVLGIISISIVAAAIGLLFSDPDTFATYGLSLITLTLGIWAPSVLKLKNSVQKDATTDVSVVAPLTPTSVITLPETQEELDKVV